jgi:hypothetical protein
MLKALSHDCGLQREAGMACPVEDLGEIRKTFFFNKSHRTNYANGDVLASQLEYENPKQAT